MSGITQKPEAPATTLRPPTGKYRMFLSDGTSSTNANYPYLIDSLGNLTPLGNLYTDENAQDAVGNALVNSSTIGFTYNDAGNQITAVVNDGSVTNAKLANETANTIKGNNTGSAAPPSDLTPAMVKTLLAIASGDVSGLTFFATLANLTGDLTTTGTGVTTIGAHAVTNGKQAQIAAHSYRGNNTGSLSDVLDISTAALTADLNAATTSLQGMMTALDKTYASHFYDTAKWNVLDHGISTANADTVNLAAWNTLMSVIPDNNVPYFPPSVNPYKFSAALSIPSGKHLVVLGDGNQKSIIQITSATADIFDCGDWFQTFRGLKFTSSVTRTAGAAINSGNNVAISVYDCDFAGMWDGIFYTGGANAGNLASVFNCGFTGTLNRVIILDGQNANTLIQQVVADGTAGVCQVGLHLLQCGSVVVTQCDFIRSVNNLLIAPLTGLGVFSVYFTNTFFDTASGSSVKIAGAGNVQRIKFVNCWFSSSVNGCEFASTAASLPTAIDFVNCDMFANSANALLATAVQDFSMANCRISGNTTAGVQVSASAGSVTRFNIQNCRIGPTAGFGGNGTGIMVNAGTYGSYSIQGNDVTGNTSNQNIIDNGTVATSDQKQIADNLGHLISGAISTISAPVTSTAATDTLLITARVPANAVSVGQTFDVDALGISSSTGTLIFRIHAGANGTTADTVAWTSITSAAQVANQGAGIHGKVVVRSVGGAGTIEAEGLGFAQAALLPRVVAAVTTPTVVTTSPWFITLSVTASTGTFIAQTAAVTAL